MYGSGSRCERLGGGRLRSPQTRKVNGIGGRAAWPAARQQWQQLSGSLVTALPLHFSLLPRSHKDGIFVSFLNLFSKLSYVAPRCELTGTEEEPAQAGEFLEVAAH